MWYDKTEESVTIVCTLTVCTVNMGTDDDKKTGEKAKGAMKGGLIEKKKENVLKYSEVRAL